MVKSWLKMTNSLDDLDAVRDNFLQFQRSLDRGQTWSVPKVVVPSLLWPNITLQPGHSVPASLNGPTQVFTAPDKTLSPLSHPVPPSIPR